MRMQPDEPDSILQKKKPRPLSVTLLSGLVLILAVVYLLRMSQGVINWSFLISLQSVPPAYVVLTGLFWGVAGLLTALLLFLGWRGSFWLAPGYLIAFSLYYWADRLFLSGYPERNVNWPFTAVINLAVIIWSLWALNRSKVRNFFEETDERRTKDRLPS